MADRIPTQRQYERLRTLAVGFWIIRGRKADYEPLIRHGWIEHDPDARNPDSYSWLRITPAGLRAVAAAVEHHGRPVLTAEAEDRG